MSYREINDKFRARTRVLVTAFVAALVAVLIWAVAVTVALDNEKHDTSGYFGDEKVSAVDSEG